MSKQARAVGLWLSLSLAACAVGPNYKRPNVKPPKAYRGDQAAEKVDARGKSLAELPWWEVFRDRALTRLLKQSLTQAYDVRMAIARVEQARAQAKAAFWAFFPGLDGQFGLTNGQGVVPPTAGVFRAYVSASWEVDVWGRLRRQKEAADALAQAADEDRRGVYVSLVGDVASTYLLLRTNDLKLELALAAVKARQQTFDLFDSRLKGGVGNELEVMRAQSLVADAAAKSASFRQAIWRNENQLSFLMARPPSAVERGVTLEAMAFPPEVPAGLPSTLLERRPDIRRAEAELHSATAVVGLRIGDVLPKFELTGVAGAGSTDLNNIVGSGTGLYRGFIGLKFPIPLLGGAGQLNAIDQAKARARELAALYEKTVMNALRETSDVLNDIQQLKVAREQRELQTRALRRAEELAGMRYTGGVANYLDVINAQEQRLFAELALADVIGEQHQAVIQLYRVLGGGWNMPPGQEKKKPDQSKADG